MFVVLFLLAVIAPPDEPGIQDNSLLTEEAYNQETNVVQHINFFQRDTRTHNWIYTITQEWPAPSIAHQLSYTVPVQTGNQIGDVALNYRYQLVGNGESKLAVTFVALGWIESIRPRRATLSLIPLCDPRSPPRPA